jgi:hypothetical protein
MDSYRKIFFHFFILTGLALSPLYDVLSKEPNFFLAHNSEPADFIVLISMLSFVFPFVIAAGGILLLNIFSSYQGLIIRIFVALFAALVLLPFVKRVMGESVYGTFISAGLLGIAFSFFYVKFSGPKLFLKYIFPAIFILPLLFLFEPKVFVLAVPEPIGEEYPVISISSDTSVVFVLLDEFPLFSILNSDLMIDRKAFPNFWRIADKSYWFRNTSADYAWTVDSVTSMLTGLKRNHALLGTYRNYPKNLFTLFGQDYQVEGYESTIRLCPPHICLDADESHDMGRIAIFWKDIGAVYLNLFLPQARSLGAPVISQKFKNF